MVNVALPVISLDKADLEWQMVGIDVSDGLIPKKKAALLREEVGEGRDANAEPNILLRLVFQKEMQCGGYVIRLAPSEYTDRLGDYARAWQGLVTGDDNRFMAKFWEVELRKDLWTCIQRPPSQTRFFTGREKIGRASCRERV